MSGGYSYSIGGGCAILGEFARVAARQEPRLDPVIQRCRCIEDPSPEFRHLGATANAGEFCERCWRYLNSALTKHASCFFSAVKFLHVLSRSTAFLNQNQPYEDQSRRIVSHRLCAGGTISERLVLFGTRAKAVNHSARQGWCLEWHQDPARDR